jgi:hypothetical protein
MNSQYRLDDAYLSCAAPVVTAAAASNASASATSPSRVGPTLAASVAATRAAAEALRTGAKTAAEVGQVKSETSLITLKLVENNFLNIVIIGCLWSIVLIRHRSYGDLLVVHRLRQAVDGSALRRLLRQRRARMCGRTVGTIPTTVG